jgi:hypothetical protein
MNLTMMTNDASSSSSSSPLHCTSVDSGGVRGVFIVFQAASSIKRHLMDKWEWSADGTHQLPSPHKGIWPR